jgi:hypothetical protein
VIARWMLPTALLLFAAWSATPALATATVVPDNCPTIQAGIESGADTVWVRPGAYAERVTLDHSAALLALGAPPPRVDGVAGPIVGGGSTVLDGFHSAAPIYLIAYVSAGNISVLNCVADSGLVVASHGGNATVSGCTVRGGASVEASKSIAVTGCTITGGLITGPYENTVSIAANTVLGPGPAGISASAANGYLGIVNNHVSATQDGIVIRNAFFLPSWVSGNHVTDCTGTAYRTTGASSGEISFSNNEARRCDGRGFDVGGMSKWFTSNTLDSIGGDGIRLQGSIAKLIDNVIRRVGGYGIVSDNSSHLFTVRGNRVVNTRLDGIHVSSADTIVRNVVGRAGGDGLVVLGSTHGFHVNRNTSCLNAGAGIRASSGSTDSVSLNLSVGNLGCSFLWQGAVPPRARVQ